MADWVDVLATISGLGYVYAVTGERNPPDYIYYRKESDGHLYEYLVADETEEDLGTIVAGAGFPPVPSPAGSALLFFKLVANDQDFEIRRKLGPAAETTVVDILDNELNSAASLGLVASNSLLVGWHGSASPEARVKYVKYSSDGSTWNDGSWSTGDHYMLSQNTETRITHYKFDNKPIIIIAVDNDDGDSEDLYEFTGGVWQAKGLLPFSGGAKWLGYCGGGYYWRGTLSGAVWDMMSGSSNLSTWTTPSDILPIPSNCIYPIGFKPLPGPPDTDAYGEIYLWDTGANDWEDTPLEEFFPLIGARYTNGQDISQIIRMDDGTLIARYWDGVSWGWRQRSEPLNGIYAEVDTGHRLWMYRGVKNATGGYDWTSRGVRTDG